MGGKRFRKKGKGDKPARQNEWRQMHYPEVKLENQHFEEYYKAQNILPTEFEEFMSTLKTPLPVSFRITGSRSNALDLCEFMKTNLFPKLDNIVIDGVSIPNPTPIPWYPNELAWVYEIGRTALRRSPQINEFHKFLVSETEVGNTSRQEVASMIPVLFMDVQPGQYILDMCAAPGSKTAQLLEGILGNLDEFPKGLVIANDADHKRAYMLVHQAKRLQTPCLMVTNHDAEEFPRIIIDEDHGSFALQFDRILCDVPCSGDGTLRKNKTIWNTWNVGNAIGLHKTQRGILRRGCELLKVGGRLVYSTCSFNPIENEAIVAAVLAESEGALRLVDVSDKLPELKRYPGLSTWKPADKKGNVYETFNNDHPSLQQSMFPPSNIQDLNIDRWYSTLTSMRVYPHLQNCGGFFVAVIEKVKPYGSIDRYNQRQTAYRERINVVDEVEEIEPDVEETKVEEHSANSSPETDADSDIPYKVVVREENGDPKAEKKKGWTGTHESPFIFVDESNPHIKTCCDTYGLGPEFPRNLFVVRSEKEDEDFGSIYVVSENAKQVLTSRNSNSLKVVNTGVKVFVKNGGKNFNVCPYRICSEGVQTVGPHLTKERQVPMGLDDLVILIRHEYPKFTLFSEAGQHALANIQQGSCMLVFDPSQETDYHGSISVPLVLPFFRANVSAGLLLDRAERKSLLNRLTGEELDVIVPLEKQ